jgi:sterol desaturase/sphingolipid hydroxylase (fatty acid hydroxylase superfamily)
MDERAIGKEDRGAWAPNRRVSYGPLFAMPWRARAVLKWFFGFPGFLMPWTIPYAVLAGVLWLWFTPPLETMKTLAVPWVLFILIRNLVLAFLVYGGWHLWFYRWKKQGMNFKYQKQWPKDRAPQFAFGKQIYDNMFYTLVSGVPIWTAYEVALLWAYANGWAPMISWSEHPIWFVALFLLVPFIHEIGFYFAHRLVHFPLLYKWAHHVHHRNVSPGPWSGLSMHPVEHVFYLMPIALFFLIPAHPVHMINLASRLGVAPAQGHTGFDQMQIGENKTFDMSYYAHYLHHKYFEVNYADGMVPLDKWFGSFHDGSPEAHQAMLDRRRRLGSKLADNG